MRENVFKYRKMIGLSIVIVMVLIIGWALYYTFFTFHITKTTPNTGDIVSSATSIIRVDVNRDIDDTLTKVVSPNTLTTTTSINGKELSIFIKDGLAINNNYYFSFEIHARDGSVINNYVFHLQTDDSTSLSSSETQLQLQNQADNKQLPKADPIMNILPHNESTYYMDVDYQKQSDSTNTKDIGINVTVFLTRDQQTNSQPVVDAAKASALKYLTDNGINPADYDITYQTQ